MNFLRVRFFTTISISRSKVVLLRIISLPNSQLSDLNPSLLRHFQLPHRPSLSTILPPALSFDQPLQLLKLQKDKLELEFKVLTISRQDRPPDNTLADPSLQDAAETTEPRRNKRNIDWPQDFVPSIQGEYDKIKLPEFVSGFLIMIKPMIRCQKTQC